MRQLTVDVNGHPYNRLLMVIILIVGSFCTVLNQTILATAYPTLSSIVIMAMVGVEMIIPIYLQTIHHLLAFESGLVLLPGTCMFGIISPVTGRIFYKHGG